MPMHGSPLGQSRSEEQACWPHAPSLRQISSTGQTPQLDSSHASPVPSSSASAWSALLTAGQLSRSSGIPSRSPSAASARPQNPSAPQISSSGQGRSSPQAVSEISSQTPSLQSCESSQSVSVEQAGESSLQAIRATAARQSAIMLALKLDIDIYPILRFGRVSGVPDRTLAAQHNTKRVGYGVVFLTEVLRATFRPDSR